MDYMAPPELKHSSSQPYCGDLAAVIKENGHVSDLMQNGHVSPSPPSPEILGPMTTEYRPLIQNIQKHIDSGDPFFSLEFFPPKTENGVANFLSRLDRLAAGGPLFVDMTWHMGSDPGSDKTTSSSSVAGSCLNYCGVETMLHITCAQYTKEQSMLHVQRTKELGLRNILALRGDLPETEEGKSAEYKYHAVDLVGWIREEHGDYFNICVAGYPTGHPDAISYDEDLRCLKLKVDAGADFIVTQLFFEEEKFVKFVRDCRAIGITVPIIPGIMPIQSYDNIRRIAQLSKLEIPEFIMAELESIKQNDEAVRNYGISLAVKMCKRLLESKTAPSIHIYTLNREAAALQILDELGLWQPNLMRLLPWKQHSAHPKRCREDVRPIFWSTRPKSYMYRTKSWDDFPNGRWGNISSPAFGELRDYYLFLQKGVRKEEALKMWGQQLDSERDVWQVFTCFVTGNTNSQGEKVKRTPWGEGEELSMETVLIKEELSWCNHHGILTINSQPSVNGAPSTDPLIGWGRPGGYCYQKAYLEFFTSEKNARALLRVLPHYPRVNYHVLNKDGSMDETNAIGNESIAVTWGVFPGSQIVQPTIVDPLSFRVWKDEAFEAWSNWARFYAEGSPSRAILDRIQRNYCLITLVDNDFPQQCCLWPLLDEMLNEAEKVEQVRFSC